MRLLALAVLSLGIVSCYPVATPRMPQSVAAALVRTPMRSVESENLRLYFPQGREDEARRFIAHVEGCAGYLKRVSRVHNDIADQKMIVMLPEMPFNNAFVAPRILGYDTEAVIPTYNTVDLFSLEMGQPPDPAGIACHEITHYVHQQQIAGFAWLMNATFGATYTPQIGLDSWFDEGLAVYYETKLQPGTGRLAWPFWRGAFAAGFAGRRINGGDLHALQRDFHAGNNYLVGSQFVRFLADRYGEDKLWQLIEVQGRSFFFPLWVNLRFWQVYDKTLSTLIDEFADEVQANVLPRARPPGQRQVHEAAGFSARYARAANGTEALITEGHDTPTRLLVYAPDGRLLADRNLAEVVPPRRLAIAAPTLTSGLSFTADARALYFVAVDIGPTFQTARLLRYDVGSGALAVVNDNLRGPGGDVSPDGTRYLFARADGDHHDLAALDLGTGAIRVLAAQEHGAYIAHPRFSPDGTRVVAQQFDGSRFRISVFDAATGAFLGVIPTDDGPTHDPSWIDENRIMYLGAAATTAGFQVYVHDLRDGSNRRITDAPYLAFEPRAAGGRTVRFLNREGWSWTVDEVALPMPSPVAAPVVAEAPAAVEPVQAQPDSPPVAAAAPNDTVAAAPPVAVSAPPASVVLMPPDALGDSPYSSLDHLFVPLLHGLTLQTVGRAALLWGAVLSGNDRLSRHRWTMAGYYQTAGTGAASVLAGYTNRQLAPLTLSFNAAQFQVHDVPPVPAGQPTPANRPFSLFRRDRQISADAIREFFGNPLSLGFAFLQTYRPDDPAVLVPTRSFGGFHLGGSFTGEEATAYTGPRRAFSVGGDLTIYPGAWNTISLSIADARGSFFVVTPLPLLRRHTLSLGARARDLLGVPGPTPLLTVGGYTSTLLTRTANRPEVTAPESGVVPPGLSFVEPLRGFEDYPFAANRIYIADATYRYPFIVDWGTASTLWLLPAFFVQQFDFELFAAGAAGATVSGGALPPGAMAAPGGTASASRHLATGAALTMRLALWTIPFGVQYQVAHRATDDHGWVQLLTLQL